MPHAATRAETSRMAMHCGSAVWFAARQRRIWASGYATYLQLRELVLTTPRDVDGARPAGADRVLGTLEGGLPL